MGPLQTNTGLLVKENSALLIDPSFTTVYEFEQIKAKLSGLKLEAVLLTHGHIDHIAGLPLVLSEYDVPVYINPEEAYFLKDASYNLSNMIPPILELDIETSDLNEGLKQVGTFEFEVVNTPGHTAGSQSFIFGEDCICGDFLFQGSVGRMDFPTGSQADMFASIQTFVDRYQNQTMRLYPGHGPSTTLAQEISSNPYVHHALSLKHD